MAPQVGLEPTTYRLTAGCSAIELLRNVPDDTSVIILKAQVAVNVAILLEKILEPLATAGMPQLTQRLSLYLADPLASDAKLLTHFL